MLDFIVKQEQKIKNIITSLGYKVDKVVLVPSSKPELGDYQFNGVMALAKQYNKNALLVAEELCNKMNQDEDYKNVNVAGPGFINITFADEAIINCMEQIRNADLQKQIPNIDKKIIIDYGGPNVAKTLHVGHLRSANIGEALKRLARFMNYEVIGDIHLGDWGRPMGLIIFELKRLHPDWVYFDENFQGEYPTNILITNDDLERLYPIASQKASEDEEYLKEAREITTKLQKKERGYYELWKQILAISCQEIKEVYERLNVSFDLWHGESDADQYVSQVLKHLSDHNLVSKSEGALIMDVSNKDDTKPMPPLLLVKSNDSISYEMTDLATIWERVHNYHPDEIWYVVDKRQTLHFDQVFRAAYKSEIVPNNVKLEFVGFGTINGKDGRPFKTRDGGVMTLKNLIDIVKNETMKKFNSNIQDSEAEQIANELSCAILKYADLLPDRMTDYIFDIEKFSDLNGKTGVYLLYSTIRMRSLLAKADENNLSNRSITQISSKEDRNIYLKVLELYAVLQKSINNRNLNDIAEYLFQITNLYNGLYSNVKILTENNNEVRTSLLALTEMVYKINQELLNILGIVIPNKI